MSSLAFLVGKLTHTGRVLTGPLYIWIGSLFAKRLPKRPSLWFCTALLAIGLAYYAFFSTSVFPDVAFYVGVFATAVHIQSLPFKTVLCRKFSSTIYFVHMVPITAFMYLIVQLPLGVELFGISMLSCVVLAGLWLFLKEAMFSKERGKRIL